MKANCSHCKRIRAAKRHPYCSVSRDGALIMLQQDDAGHWNEKRGGAMLTECKYFEDARRKNSGGLWNPGQCILPGTEGIAAQAGAGE